MDDLQAKIETMWRETNPALAAKLEASGDLKVLLADATKDAEIVRKSSLSSGLNESQAVELALDAVAWPDPMEA